MQMSWLYRFIYCANCAKQLFSTTLDGKKSQICWAADKIRLLYYLLRSYHCLKFLSYIPALQCNLPTLVSNYTHAAPILLDKKASTIWHLASCRCSKICKRFGESLTKLAKFTNMQTISKHWNNWDCILNHKVNCMSRTMDQLDSRSWSSPCRCPATFAVPS